MKLPLVALATVALCGALARDASSASMPSYGSLPAGDVGDVPGTRAAPASIGARERVAGFYLAEQGGASRVAKSERQAARWSFLFGNPDDARQFRVNQGGAATDASVCFTTAEQARMFTRSFLNPGEPEPEPVEWPSWFESRPSFGFDPNVPSQQLRSPGMSANGVVVAVHAERLVRGETGHATLAMTDAWVDRRSRGVRLIGSSALPLVRVATGPSGIEVYAARSATRTGGVELVVTGPTVGEGFDANARQFARQFSRLTASLGEGRNGNSDCGHIRVALHPRSEDGPEMAVVQTVALLPPVEEIDDSTGPTPGGTATANPAALGLQKIQAMRKRPLTVSMSATQTSADGEPVLSVAIGWAGREQR